MRVIFTLFLILSLSGCIPKTHTASPSIEGVVLDAKTNQPIANVQVGSQLTDSNGKFFIEGETELGIGTPMGGVWSLPTVIIRITKEGYQSSSYECSILSTQKGCFDVVIKLQKVKDKSSSNKKD